MVCQNFNVLFEKRLKCLKTKFLFMVSENMINKDAAVFDKKKINIPRCRVYESLDLVSLKSDKSTFYSPSSSL